MDAGQHESRFENTARRENDYEADCWSFPQEEEKKKKKEKNLDRFACDICKDV